MISKEYIDRFWGLVDVGGEDDCWEWRRARSGWKEGYGVAPRINGKGAVRSHRVAYEIVNGPIPDGMFVCHHCDNPPCCNPKHLFIGTPKDNTHDMVSKERGGRPPSSRGTRNPHNVIGESDVMQICKLLDAGIRSVDIAEQLGVTESIVSCINTGKAWGWLTHRDSTYKKTGMRGPNLKLRGESNNSSKLTEAEVIEICEKYNSGQRTTYLAREYGVSMTLIRYIRTGKAWGWLTGITYACNEK